MGGSYKEEEKSLIEDGPLFLRTAGPSASSTYIPNHFLDLVLQPMAVGTGIMIGAVNLDS